MLRQIIFVFIVTQFISQINCFQCDLNDNYRGCTMSGLNLSSPFTFDFEDHSYRDTERIQFKNSTMIFFPSGIFSNLYRLTTIVMSNCGIEHIPVDSFYNANYLKWVDLSKNKIKIIVNDLFSQSPNLLSINLASNCIETIEENAFANISKLQYLTLSNNKIKKISKEMMKNFLRVQYYLYLNENEIEDVQDFSSYEQTTFNSLTLNFSNNHLKEFVLCKNGVYINKNNLTYLNITKNVNYVYASNNKLSTISIENVESVSHLELSNNLITDLDFIRNLINLVMLDLSFNKIELKVGSLSLLENLKDLNLKSCELTTLQFGTFSHQKKLQVLNISYNKLMKIDWHIFTGNNFIEQIFIDGNNLTEFSTETMISVFPRLQEIGLSDNNWNCTFLSALIRNLRSHDDTFLNKIVRNETNIAGIFCSDKTTENVNSLEDGKPLLNINKVHHTEDTELKEELLRLQIKLEYERGKKSKCTLSSNFEILGDKLQAIIIINLLMLLTGLLFISFMLTIFYFYKRKALIRKTKNSINILDDVL